MERLQNNTRGLAQQSTAYSLQTQSSNAKKNLQNSQSPFQTVGHGSQQNFQRKGSQHSMARQESDKM
jgi:hypothetical protein